MALFWGAVCVCVILATNPAGAVFSAQNALAMWRTSVAPTLLPFFIVLPALTGESARRVYRALLGRVTAVFGLGGETAGALVVGLLAGSPAGAAAVNATPGLTKARALRLSVLASGASPIFLASFVGASLFEDASVGWLIYRAQAVSGMLTAWLLCAAYKNDALAPCLRAEGGASDFVLGAVLKVLTVGGYMTLFTVLADALGGALGEAWRDPLLCLFEIAGGCRAAAGMGESEAFRAALTGAVACFGGLSVTAQSMRYLRPMGIRDAEYVSAKLIQSTLAFWLIYAAKSGWTPDPALAACALSAVLPLVLLLILLRARNPRPA